MTDSEKPVRVAVMGVGQRGLQHLTVLWRLQQEGLVQVAALCDAFPANLSQEKLSRIIPGFQLDGIATYQDAHAMLSEVSLDALYLAIPPSLHQGELIAAARRGIHIFTEKPQSLFYDEAVAMDEAIREAGVTATVGFQRRYEARSRGAYRFLQDKRMVMATIIIDRPVEAHSVKHTHTEEMDGPADRVWTKDAAWSGTTVVESAIHDTDLLRYWCGEIDWVQATYVPRAPDDAARFGDNPAAYSVSYGFRDGGVANLLLSRLSRSLISNTYRNILWEHGHLRFEGTELNAYGYRGPYPPEASPRAEELVESLQLPPAVSTNEAISRAFVKALVTGDDGDLLSSFHNSLPSLAAVLAANTSHTLGGRRIALDEFASSPEYAAYRRKPAQRG